MLQRLGFPDVGRHRRFVGALAVDALGSGVWMPLSILYFLHQTDLTLVQVGLVMTVANLVVLPVVPVIGQLVDVLGARRLLQSGNLVQAAAFAAYPLAHSIGAVGLVVAVATVGRSAFWGSHGPLVAQIAPPGQRELWFGFVGAMRNVGFGVGGLLAALALSVGTGAAYDAVVLANALSYLLAFVLMLGVSAGGRPEAAVRAAGGWGLVLRDRGYRWVVVGVLFYALVGSALNVTMPVYVADLLGLPGWVPGAMFVINTVLVGAAQGVTVRAMTGARRYRVLLVAVGATAASFVLLWCADALGRAPGTVLVLVAVVVFTVGELVAAPVISALGVEAAPADQRGRYLSVVQLGWNVAGAVAPLLYAALLSRGSLLTWAGSLALCGAWALVTLRLRHVVPLAAEPVTNRAEPAHT